MNYVNCLCFNNFTKRIEVITIVQDQVNDRCVALSVKTSKLTSRVLARAMLSALKHISAPSIKHGEQSLKSLTKQGAALENIEISNEDIGSFKKIARKYNIDFALQKDTSKFPHEYLVFFKSKDSKSLEQAFKEYTSQQLKFKGTKPPMTEKMADIKSSLVNIEPSTKSHNKGEISL